MPALVPKGAPEGSPQLEVSDEQVEFWTARGYVPVEAPKAPAKKAGKSKK